MPTMEAVLINCHRPKNLVRILPAIAPQVNITTVLDCSRKRIKCTADRTIEFPVESDLGPWTRFAAVRLYEQEFTLFLDDDLLPDFDMIRRLLVHAAAYDVVGGVGRNLTSDSGYRALDCPPGEADIAIRCQLWRTSILRTTVTKAMTMLSLEDRRNDDDITMCPSLGRKVYVVPGKIP